MDNIVYIDVETRWPQSNQIRDYVVRNAQPDSRLKDPAKIAASIEDNQRKAIESTSLQPMWGELAVLCWTQQPDAETAYWGNEVDILHNFNAAMKKISASLNGRAPIFCGFNVGFDLRFIWTRMMIHGVKLSVGLHHDAPPWSDRIIDLRAVLNGSDRMAKGTLQDWCVAFGREPRADDVPGKDVPQAILDGRLEEVVTHCRMDVNDAAWLHGKIRP